MKLRVAKKVLKPLEDGGVDPRYRSSTLERALSRMQKTATEKETNRYWDWLMDTYRLDFAEMAFDAKIKKYEKC